MMKTELREINSFTRELDVIVPWDDLKDKFMIEFNEFRLKYSQKGFRRGKVPVNIIKKSYGPAIEMDYADKAVSEYYSAALIEQKLDPINRAQIKELSFHEGDELTFTAVFEIQPSFELPEYTDKIKISAVKLTHTETDIESALSDQQQRHSAFRSVEGDIMEGHFIKGSFQELDAGGEPVLGKDPESKYFVIGSPAFSGEIAEIFKGAKKGDIVEVTPTVAENPVSYKVTIEEVEYQTLPEIDDELAKKIDPKAASLDDLKSKMAVSMDQQLEKEFQMSVQSKISGYFVDNTEVDVPTSWKENYLKHSVEDVKKQLKPGEPFNEQEIREKYSDTANNNLKWHLIRGKLMDAENLVVTDDDIQSRIDNMTKESETNAAQIKAYYKKQDHRDDLKEDIANEILFDKLKDYAVIKEITKTTDEFREEAHDHE